MNERTDSTASRVDIIVPIYNQERYLEQCVRSVQAQTFADFRLILVDDGSRDRSGAICDRFAAADARCRAIHQVNGGVSAARNAGLDWARAHGPSELTAFVDPDDCLAPDYLETLVRGIGTGCDIAAVGFLRFEEGGAAEFPPVRPRELQILTVEDYWMHPDWLPMVPWGKLFRSRRLEGFRYPQGHVHEDEWTTHRLLFAVERMAFCADALYGYRSHGTSITGAGWNAKSVDHVSALADQVDFFASRGLERPLAAARRLLVTYCVRAINELGYRQCRPLLRKQLRELGWPMVWNAECFLAAYPVRTRLLLPLCKLRERFKS